MVQAREKYALQSDDAQIGRSRREGDKDREEKRDGGRGRVRDPIGSKG